jgi:alpha-L-rhamnosidase
MQSDTGAYPIVFLWRGFPLAICFLFIFTELHLSATGIDAPQKAWSAEWIAVEHGPARDFDVVYFRRPLRLEAVPSRFVVDVSADTRFELHVNGQRVGAGPALADVHHWRYEVFDLAPYLHVGKNQIAAIVWNYGVDAAVAQMSSRTAFLLSAEDPVNADVNTGKGWEARHESGRSLDTMNASDYYAAGPPEAMDGRKMDWGWDGVDASELWTTAKSIGHAAPRQVEDSPTPWMLVKDELPPMQYAPISAGHVVRMTGMTESSLRSLDAPVVVPAHADVTILLDHDVLTTAFPSLDISGGRDASVVMTYAEALYDANGKKGNRNEIAGRHIAGLHDRIISDGLARSYRTLWWRTWRYLQIEVKTGDAPLTLGKLRGFYTAYPFKAVGRFESDDPELTRIWETGWRTAQLCAHETYMDTPYWEQLQYVGDTRIQALISYGVTGDDRLGREAMEAYRDSLMPEGLTQSRYPSSLTQIIPPFSLLWVGMLHDYWEYRDDPVFVASMLPETRGVLDWFAARQRADGLLGRISWWPFVDWSPPDFDGGVPPQEADGGSSALTLQYIEALRYGAEMEDQFGEKARAQDYKEKERLAADGLMRLNWNEKDGLLGDTPAKNHFSQQANSLAVWLDVIPHDRQEAVMKKVLGVADGSAVGGTKPMSPASYYFRFYVARAMVHAGLGDLYVPQLAPWRTMLTMGLSTWAETLEPTRSDSHAWSAHPTLDLMTIVAGIAPGAPGFKRVAITPHLGQLKDVAAAMPTPHGLVEVSYRKGKDGWVAKITLPESISGSLDWHGRSIALHPGAQMLTLEP